MTDAVNAAGNGDNADDRQSLRDELAKVQLIGGGRGIDERGNIPVEIADDRSAADIHNNRPSTQLRAKILALPEEPGVYLYINRAGKVIYVGKAKRLKRRVSSYFNRRHDSIKTNLLVRNIADMRFIVVPTEEDALHLEDAMIKAYQPHYNILLKDDKSYPWIVVTKEPYPRVFMTREKGISGRYYGPYANPASAKAVLDLIREIFPLRSCRHFIDRNVAEKGKLRLCLDYHIHKCKGPCRGLVSEEEYGETVKRVRQILNGETGMLQQLLRHEMSVAAERLQFEKAQILKEQVALVEKYNAKSLIPGASKEDMDVFAYEQNSDAAIVNFMHLHHGAVVQSLNLEYRRRNLDVGPGEILSMAIGEISRRFQRKFTEVIVPFLPDVEFSGVRFSIPVRGDKRKMLDMSRRNAVRYLEDREKQKENLDPDRSVRRLMERMKSDFRLQREPRHIECFDNSNIQGSNPVASCVVFRNGKPSRRDYRHFIIKTVVGADDFASMKEVLHRRYSRMMAEGQELPQLVVVDGGKGQLSAAVEAFEEMGIRGKVALIGIAKRLEEIYFPGDSLPLYIDKKSESLRVIQALRDEAHRFGITHHRLRRSKSQISSELDNIKGIGPATSQALIKHFRSLKRVREASLDDVAAVVGVAKARLLRDHFHYRKE